MRSMVEGAFVRCIAARTNDNVDGRSSPVNDRKVVYRENTQ
jgi:hypothetical protein